LGDGVPKLAQGGPPGGAPGDDPESGPYVLLRRRKPGPGGSGGGPWGGPGGVSVGPRGPLGGSGGPSRGGTPRGAPWWPPSLRTLLPFWSRPPGGPPGGPFWGVRTRRGQYKPKCSLTEVYRGGRGAPPKSALGALPAGGPKKGPILGLCGCFYPSFAVDRTMSLLVVLFVFSSCKNK
jgi:hypothetical protein